MMKPKHDLNHLVQPDLFNIYQGTSVGRRAIMGTCNDSPNVNSPFLDQDQFTKGGFICGGPYFITVG